MAASPVMWLPVVEASGVVLYAGRTRTNVFRPALSNVASWATAALSPLGRTFVVRRCMASKFTYHAAFHPAPQWFLQPTAVRLQPSRRAAKGPDPSG
jgi:hypothetical protein